ncbi:UNVERIFIED_CONTAM: Ribosome biogenesis protein BOP1 [Sesamum radiatum]|uniref:Ribosome biogenesis protein BOP1 n=1 Tax=Sesamum radiatum TaxID=300843 RepID=A0AAW2RZ07_SESRA
MGPKPRKENGSGKPKDEKAEKKVQKLKAKNVEENLKRIEEAEAAAESSEDSPFVSDSGEDDDEPYVDWFAWDGAKHPLTNAPEPKRRFIPSKWESKMVLRYVRAIRKGLIKFDDKPKEEPRFYALWDDSTPAERQGLAYIPAPKPKLPGHEESYNPSPEYIPTQEEINSYQLMFEEDRPKFIPKQHTSLRSVPAYEKAVQETFDRCLDLYLCPRVRKKRINIDPESLKPKLPSRKDLKPYPTICYLEYKGHKGPVTTISTESTGQWIASGDNAIIGSKDGKLCWFDMDLSSRPYRVLRCHPKDITSVAYHRSYPLFASCSDDCTAYVFHGMVYSDLNQNPLIVPLEILRGHSSADGRVSWTIDGMYGSSITIIFLVVIFAGVLDWHSYTASFIEGLED